MISSSKSGSRKIQRSLEKFLEHKRTLDCQRTSGDETLDIYYRGFEGLKAKTLKLRIENTHPNTYGEKPCNYRKNRFKDILPYDYTRVPLQKVEGRMGSDYINANFIKGILGNNGYIAAQGPLPGTVDDFWRMMWEYEIDVVLMACNVMEGFPRKSKCHTYWPEKVGEQESFGDFSVTLIQIADSTSDDFVERVLEVRHGEECRTVYQLHYVKWPDHGTPTEMLPILEMLRRARELHSPKDSVPLVVHCSAGCGRTGSIIAVDFVWDLLKSGNLDRKFNLHQVMLDLREQRPAMVQTVEQYMFVFNCVAELFEQHLDLIKKHMYENVTVDGKDVAISDGEDEDDDDYEENEGDEDQQLYANIGTEQVESPKNGPVKGRRPTLPTRPSNVKSQTVGQVNQRERPPIPKFKSMDAESVTSSSEKLKSQPNGKKSSPTGTIAERMAKFQTEEKKTEDLKVKAQPSPKTSPLHTSSNPKVKSLPPMVSNADSVYAQVQGKSARGPITMCEDYSQPCENADENSYSTPYDSQSQLPPKLTTAKPGKKTLKSGVPGVDLKEKRSSQETGSEEAGQGSPKSPGSPAHDPYSYADPYRDNKWSLQHVALSAAEASADKGKLDAAKNNEQYASYEDITGVDDIEKDQASSIYSTVEGSTRHESAVSTGSYFDDSSFDEDEMSPPPVPNKNFPDHPTFPDPEGFAANSTTVVLANKMKTFFRDMNTRIKKHPATGPYIGKCANVSMHGVIISFPQRVGKPKGIRKLES